jgi:tetratricopeptide (TPR) repeat protein
VSGNITGIFAIMRTTSSFEIFPTDASEQDLAKARRHRQEGRAGEAEAAYRSVMKHQPGLRTSWTECFDLLRQAGRADDALALAVDAERRFSAEAFPIALKGAALIEQRRFEEALAALETAVERDPYLALTWHELGNAAFRLGDGSRALLALDRAFALEPHTETLTLRGRILRDAGELYAATVAFEAAMHSATHEEQRAEIEGEIQLTQRLGDFAPRRLKDLTPGERWFAEHGVVVLAAAGGASAPPLAAHLVEAFAQLAEDRDWGFGQLLAHGTSPLWPILSERLGLPWEYLNRADPDRVPLLVAERPPHDDPQWESVAGAIRDSGKGAVFTVWHPAAEAPEVDVVGGLEERGAALALGVSPTNAIVMAQHPGAGVNSRDLAHRTPPAPE